MIPFAEDWQLARTPPDLARTPDALPPGLAWVPAHVPGTAAAALRAAGLWDGVSPLELDREDVWYRGRVALDGRHRLRFAGLATLAEAWLDGAPLLASDNMFLPATCEAELRRGAAVHIRFRALSKALEGRRGRPRWRPRMIAPPSLRAVRTTLLGHMPGWCPEVHAVGPWRGIEATPLDGTTVPLDVRLSPGLTPDGTGRLALRLRLSSGQRAGRPARLRVAGHEAALDWSAPDALAGALDLPGIEPWWPHTHGEPALHEAELAIGEARFPLGPVGFRRIELDRGADGHGFALRVNGVPVFCRGACWVGSDLAALPEAAEAVEPRLRSARDAGLNTIRVPGVAVYEGDPFYAACDRLGLLVWQDFMFANFDYPADDAFLDSATREVDAFLDRTAGRACLTVLCGGSEIAQQAAMLGVPEDGRGHVLFDGIMPARVAAARPDVPFVPHSPGGGALPFLPGSGVAHYYGVGAYRRPLDDARRAGVRFASECLALANVPEDEAIAAGLGTWHAHDPRWKAGVPRDAGAGWDFEDVRDHYLAELFGADPRALRAEEPERYLDLSRATSCELIEHVFAEWRRPGSGCAGGLVWTLSDLRPGAGWGVLDWRGQPKPAWYALRRACRPLTLAITDEGLNGLALHALNDGAHPVEAELRLELFQGETRVAGGSRAVTLPARGGLSLGSAELLAGFFDVTYAYRFGPPGHDVAVASLHRPGPSGPGAVIAEAFHLPRGLSRPPTETVLDATLARTDTGWCLRLRAARFAQSVHLIDRHFRAEESWFHMAPGRDYALRLTGPEDRRPSGEVRALNAAAARYEAA